MVGRGYRAAVKLGVTAALGVLAFAGPAAAQSQMQNPAEKAPIIATIDSFMKALTVPDAAAMSALLAPLAVFSGERKNPDGSMGMSRTPGDAWVTRMKAGGLVEKIYNPVVLQRGTIAMVWAPFDAVHDGKMSHCGIDGFDMVKMDGAWKIASVIWTTEPTGCKELKVPGY
jgi:hypothetical protein